MKMGHFVRLFGFGAALAVLLASAGTDEVFAQKKDKKADSKANPATPADYALMQKNKEVTGTIIGVGGGGVSISLRVDTPHMEPNPNYKPPTVTNPNAAGYNQQANQQYQQLRQYNDIQRQMQQAAKAKSPQEQQRIMNRLQLDMARFQQDQQRQLAQQMAKAVKGAKNPGGNSNSEPFRIVHQYKDYEFELQEGAVLRKVFLATEYDDTGNIKEYTEKVKAELRGTDKTKPGYLARLDEIIPGAEAKLTLIAPKATKKDPKAKDDDGIGNVDRPIVKMVVLTKESTSTPVVGGAPKKKDKK